MLKIFTHCAEETKELGIKLGSMLRPGSVICLTGNLGTGKTAFTQGIAIALDIKGYITSPTFTIVNEYAGRLPLYHFDVYRIADSEEMYEIGFEEYISGSGVVVIEWADLIKEILPEEYIWVEIRKNLTDGVDTREIILEFVGDMYREMRAAWGEVL